MTSRLHLLIVDDDERIRVLLQKYLIKNGFLVSVAKDAGQARRILDGLVFDLIIMDVMMPEMDGIEACEQIRTIPEIKETIITFLTARGEDYSQVAGFEAGADDYITKPIKPKVLVSKIKSLLRRRHGTTPVENSDIITLGDLTIDREAYKIIHKDVEIVLPRKEFELLSLLASKPGKVFKRDVILDKVWGNEVVVGGRTIDVHIRKLREKIGDDSFKTIKGVGYKFQF